MKRTFALLLALASLTCLAPAAKQAQEDEGTVRLRENKKNASLQTATITMQNADGVTLDLVGAIHIGEKQY
ncbi:MAG: hypothetical protein P8J87_17830, partial [Verrucomicrobiales bacterium]|nr:hypothetical protein [Verrucomicrobiales bacterium]